MTKWQAKRYAARGAETAAFSGSAASVRPAASASPTPKGQRYETTAHEGKAAPQNAQEAACESPTTTPTPTAKVSIAEARGLATAAEGDEAHSAPATCPDYTAASSQAANFPASETAPET